VGEVLGVALLGVAPGVTLLELATPVAAAATSPDAGALLGDHFGAAPSAAADRDVDGVVAPA